MRVWLETDGFPCVATLYRGEAVNALTPLYRSGGATARCYLAAGEQVAIGVTSVYWPIWGGGGGAGWFRLHLEFMQPAPTSPNDRFEDALAISGSPYHASGNLHGATRDAGEPMGIFGDAGAGWQVWSERRPLTHRRASVYPAPAL